MDDENNNEAPAPEAAPVEPAPPAEKTFTQAELDVIVTKAKAQAKRQAKKEAAVTTQPIKEETTTSAGDDRIEAMAGQLQELTGALGQLIAKQSETDVAKQFDADTTGVTLSENDAKTLRVLQQHSPELYAEKLAEFKAKDTPPAPTGQGYNSAGAPAAAAPGPSLENMLTWSKDDIAAMKTAGTFKSNLRKARDAMPGGGSGLFKRNRK